MTARQLRIRVRGEFRQLTAAQRQDLLARAADHDPLRVQWLPEGSLGYDLAARPFFTFRFTATAADDAGEAAAVERAVGAARRYLDERGLGHRLLAPQVEDLSEAPLSGRQRRARTAG